MIKINMSKTCNQLIRTGRKKIINKTNLSDPFGGAPQALARCQLVTTKTPKKPNSALRKVCKVKINKTKKSVWAFIPGEGHNLQQHSLVLLQKTGPQDLPGCSYAVIRGGNYDCKPVDARRVSPSKYGVKIKTRMASLQNKKNPTSTGKPSKGK